MKKNPMAREDWYPGLHQRLALIAAAFRRVMASPKSSSFCRQRLEVSEKNQAICLHRQMRKYCRDNGLRNRDGKSKKTSLPI
jgi:hypothetical protein